ncbi:adenosine receptor A3-like [Stylophora pistillata]|uniref:adenosine receptor A3-like n=1 Tax=Stylophora pistillata TaxID=50429 RepID=UPI000C03DEC2|nr:adenosine receptor A3-like [Stylophora pistillata]
METTLPVIFGVIYFLEGLLALLGNIFTIFVFWKHRAELKRTSYLLVNLAFADVLVAISILIALGCEVRNLAEGNYYMVKQWQFIFFMIWDTLCETTSLLSLLVISFERLYAVRWPFRHRTLSTRTYIYTLFFVWVIAVLILAFICLSLAFVEHSRVIYTVAPFLSSLVLILICVGYFLIYLQTKQNIPDGFHQSRIQQNKKLSKTLCIVTFSSLACWFPSIVIALAIDYTKYYTANSLNLTHSSHNLIRFFKVMQYGNSLVNPIVYSFRMPLFKSEIKECLIKIFGAREAVIGADQQIGVRSKPSKQKVIDLDDTKL